MGTDVLYEHVFSCQPLFCYVRSVSAAFVLDPDGNNIEAVRREFS